jgi:hypothetical protein
MVSQDSLLVTFVNLVDRLPMPALPTKRERGRPKVYPDRLFLKALVIMIVRHLHNVHELLSVLAQPTAEMRRLRDGRSRARTVPNASHLGTATDQPFRTRCLHRLAVWVGICLI